MPAADGKLYIAEWVDATNVGGWLTDDEIAAFARDGGWLCHNVGFLLYEDVDCVVLSARRAHAGLWGLSERIPRQSLISLRLIEVDL